MNEAKSMDAKRTEEATAKLDYINGHLAAGRTVYLCTYTSAVKITAATVAKWAAANRPLLKVVGGSLLVGRGRSYDCHDFSAIRVA